LENRERMATKRNDFIHMMSLEVALAGYGAECDVSRVMN
jgi:hypothetical protein